MEELVIDLERRGLNNAESILAHFVQEELISTSRAAKVLRHLQDAKSSKALDVTQLHQILETINKYGKVDEDVLIDEITGKNMKSHKNEVSDAYYNWKKTGFQAAQDVSAYQVESRHRHSPKRTKSPRRKSSKHKPAKVSDNIDDSDMDDVGGFQCNEGCCRRGIPATRTAGSDDSLSESETYNEPQMQRQMRQQMKSQRDQRAPRRVPVRKHQEQDQDPYIENVSDDDYEVP